MTSFDSGQYRFIDGNHDGFFRIHDAGDSIQDQDGNEISKSQLLKSFPDFPEEIRFLKEGEGFNSTQNVAQAFSGFGYAPVQNTVQTSRGLKPSGGLVALVVAGGVAFVGWALNRNQKTESTPGVIAYVQSPGGAWVDFTTPQMIPDFGEQDFSEDAGLDNDTNVFTIHNVVESNSNTEEAEGAALEGEAEEVAEEADAVEADSDEGSIADSLLAAMSDDQLRAFAVEADSVDFWNQIRARLLEMDLSQLSLNKLLELYFVGGKGAHYYPEDRTQWNLFHRMMRKNILRLTMNGDQPNLSVIRELSHHEFMVLKRAVSYLASTDSPGPLEDREFVWRQELVLKDAIIREYRRRGG